MSSRLATAREKLRSVASVDRGGGGEGDGGVEGTGELGGVAVKGRRGGGLTSGADRTEFKPES